MFKGIDIDIFWTSKSKSSNFCCTVTPSFRKILKKSHFWRNMVNFVYSKVISTTEVIFRLFLSPLLLLLSTFSPYYCFPFIHAPELTKRVHSLEFSWVHDSQFSPYSSVLDFLKSLLQEIDFWTRFLNLIFEFDFWTWFFVYFKLDFFQATQAVKIK